MSADAIFVVLLGVVKLALVAAAQLWQWRGGGGDAAG